MASPRAYRLMNFIENNLALMLVALTVIIVERVVKYYIVEFLRLGESIPVIGNFFMITRIENSGAGFGVLAGQSWIFIGAACLVLLLIIIYYNRIIYNRLLVFASAFILAGTVGNMMDRLFFGRVIDYLDFSFWPTFNLSDVSLLVGVVLLGIYMYIWQKGEPEHEVTYVRY